MNDLQHVQALTLLALATAREAEVVLNAEPNLRRREVFRKHFIDVLGEELLCGALSRGLGPSAAIPDALLHAERDEALVRGPADFECGGVQ